MVSSKAAQAEDVAQKTSDFGPRELGAVERSQEEVRGLLVEAVEHEKSWGS